MIIQCSTFRLRPWQTGDVTSLPLHANNKKVWDNLRDYFPHPYTVEDAKAWIIRQIKIQPPLNLAIDVEGQAVGGIGLIPGRDVERISAEIGYWLGEAFWGRGIMTEAVKAMVRYAMDDLKFIRLYAGVFSGNPGSMRVLEKAGFQKEGVFTKAILKNGKILDEHRYGIWKE